MKFNGSKTELAKLFSLYNLDVLNFSIFESGIINTSYFLKLKDKSKLVLRVYNSEKKKKDIVKELNFIEELRDCGIPVPLIKNNIFNKNLSAFKDSAGKKWKVIAGDYAEGRHLKANDFKMIPEFAKYQAKMHLASAKLNKKSAKADFKAMIGWMDKEFEKSKIKRLDKATKNKIENIYKDLKTEIKLNLKEILALPFGNVHLDYDSENIIVKNNKIMAILDFDDISCQPFILDIANSLWWWLFKNKKGTYNKILSNYFKNYQKTRKISEREYKFLKLFIRMRNFTLMCLLYINLPKLINQTRINECLSLDSNLKN